MDIGCIEDLMANTMLVKAKDKTDADRKWRKNFRLPEHARKSLAQLRDTSNDTSSSFINKTEEAGVNYAVLSSTDSIVKKLEVELYSQLPAEAEMNNALRMRFEFSLFCEKQCIGKEMFNQYCQKADQKVRNVNAMMQAIWDFEVAEGEERTVIVTRVANTYLKSGAPHEISFVSEETKSACVEVISSSGIPDYDKLREILSSRQNTSTDCAMSNLAVAVTSYQPDLITTHLSETEKRFYFIKLLFDRCKQQMYPYLVEEVYPAYKKSEEYQIFLRWKTKEKESVVEEDFVQYRLLGRGGFGEVYAYKVKCSTKMYAIKKIDKKKMKQKHAEKVVMAEKITLEMVNSPFVVSLTYAYENKQNLNLAMTLMEAGDLKFHVYDTADGKKRGISAERTWFYTAQITLGLDHLHDKNILYRDMKPENVLLDCKGNVRIADLGLVCILGSGKKTTGRAGTIGYMAPEMLQGEKYAYGVDWFALGCTIFEMAEGKGPFIVKEKGKRRMSVNATIEKTVHEPHSYKRKHADQLVDLIDQLLIKDINQRLAGDERSAEPIKQHAYFADLNWERLEAGLVPPSFIPNPNQVYAKDVSDIKVGSDIKGIVLTDEDKEYYKKFATGKVAIPWQQEMMETNLFHEVMNRLEEDDKKAAKTTTNSNKKSKFCLLL